MNQPIGEKKSPTIKTAEQIRLEEAREQKVHWKKWGPYLSERQWGTVREDYSEGGDAWSFFAHDHALARVQQAKGIVREGTNAKSHSAPDTARGHRSAMTLPTAEIGFNRFLSALCPLSSVLFLLLSGCTHLGPKTVAVDRFDYSTAIGDSWKQQTLLNIVKLRYMDLPVFLDVASIVAGYSMQTGVSVNGTLSSEKAIQGDFASIGGSAIYTDRPTITYVPMTGEKFLRGLITPIDPKNIFFLLQSGYAADFVLGMAVESLNGVRNRSTTGGAVREADPEFFRALDLLRQVQAAGGAVREADPEFIRALQLLREVQVAGAVGMRVEEDKARNQTAVLFFRRDDVPADIVAKAAEIRRLLKLPPDQQKYALTYSPVRGAENELAVNSRSMLQIMAAFASYLDVPETDLKEHRAVPAFENGAPESRRDGVRIHSGKEKPADAFAAVHYRGHWFWIDDGDWQTKRALTAVMFFFTLAETGSAEKLPLITIPAQ